MLRKSSTDKVEPARKNQARKRRSLSRAYCVYCGEPASTKDHVPPKLLMERPLPVNLRTVPSCLRCNHGASLDEQYFLCLLGHVSLSSTITAKLEPGGIIDRTLERSPALEERLLQALATDEETGNVFIRPETPRVALVIRKIAVGLFALRYGRVPSPDGVGPVGLYPYQLRDDRPLPYFIATFTERFESKQWRTVQRDVFSYIFVRDPKRRGNVWCIMDIHHTLWGVVHFANPKKATARASTQLSLFPENNAA